MLLARDDFDRHHEDVRDDGDCQEGPEEQDPEGPWNALEVNFWIGLYGHVLSLICCVFRILDQRFFIGLDRSRLVHQMIYM